MPQLNPLPWLMIFIASWLIFILILPSKIVTHKYPNEPTLKNTMKAKTEPWSWPWPQVFSTSL